jgi:tetratricopeptide (TPR) repeat protein
LLQRRAAVETNQQLKTAVNIRLATLKLDDKETASQACRRVLEDHPSERRALDLLDRIARTHRDTTLLEESLARRQSEARSPAERAMILYLRGRLEAQKGQQADAQERWKESLSADSLCRPAYEALRRSAVLTEKPELLLWCLENGLESVHDDATLLRDLLLRAKLRLEGNELDGALHDYDRVLELQPGRREAVEGVHKVLAAKQAYDDLAERLRASRDASESPLQRTATSLQLARLYRENIGDVRQAAEILATTVEKDPDNVAALLMAADIQAELEQPTEAISLLSRAILRSENDTELIGAHLATAQLFHDILGIGDRALRSLRAVLKLDPENRAALRMMAEVNEQSGNDNEAATYLERWSKVEPDDATRATVLARLCGILRSSNGDKDEQTIRVATAAIEAAPENPDVLEIFCVVMTGAEKWTELEEQLKKSLALIDADHQVRFNLERGKVLWRHLDRKDEATEIVRSMLSQDPNRDEAIELMVEILDEGDLDDPELRDEAIALHRRLLARDATNVTSIRRLGELCDQAKRIDEAFCASSALIFLGKASEEETYFHKQRRRLLPVANDGRLEESSLEPLLLPEGDHPVRKVLEIVKGHLNEITPPDFSQYGVHTLEQAHLDEDHAAWDVARACATLLGTEAFVLAEAIGGAAEGATEPGCPPTLMLPRDFGRLPVPQQRFICGRMLARVWTSTECCDPRRPESMTTRAIEMLLAALGRTKDPEFGEGVASPAILNDMKKRLTAALTGDQLSQACEHAISAFEARESLGSWLQSCEVGAIHAALLCAGNLDALAALTERSGRSLSTHLVRHIISFVVSEEHARLRKQLGLAISEGGC